MSRFLQDSGLLESGTAGAAPAPGMLGQMRNKASDLVLDAMDFLGVPYRRGGTSVETGFDCSGFTRHVFESSVGLLLPRRSSEQAGATDLQSVKRDELKPGDLVFFNTMRKAFSHVGIYVGDGKFVHAPRTGSQVRVEDMREAYWTKRFNGARRVPGLNTQALSSSLQSFTGGALTGESSERQTP
ncbi:MAG: C40 family peptidase [Leptothrix sp. (in: b-proteobacteria)]